MPLWLIVSSPVISLEKIMLPNNTINTTCSSGIENAYIWTGEIQTKELQKVYMNLIETIQSMFTCEALMRCLSESDE